jgi:hypothetical protein
MAGDIELPNERIERPIIIVGLSAAPIAPGRLDRGN